MADMKWYDWLAIILLVVGGINWGVVGVFNFDLVVWALSKLSFLYTRIVYTIVGVAGVYGLFFIIKQIIYK